VIGLHTPYNVMTLSRITQQKRTAR